MASTYLSLHYHIVFSTKSRAPLIAADWRPRLHEYLGGTVRGLAGNPEQVGGTADHVHLLIGLKATHCLADVMRELKKASSSWVHQEVGARSFAWQEGYSAFTMSATARPAVLQYIANQEEHHRVKSFREELVGCSRRPQSSMTRDTSIERRATAHHPSFTGRSHPRNRRVISVW